jgi:hypothetical protein
MTAETDGFASLDELDFTGSQQTAICKFYFGGAVVVNGAVTSFTRGAQAPAPGLVLEMNLNNSNWSASNGQNGMLTADQITAVAAALGAGQAAFKATLEQLALTLGVLPGTFVAG